MGLTMTVMSAASATATTSTASTSAAPVAAVFLRDCWYVIEWSRDLTDAPVGKTVCGEAIVVYRTASGQVAALEDHCPHRHVPLSMGKVVGEVLQCAYHGLCFDGSGTCVKIPSQTLIPPAARVKAYPVVERYGWVWVWIGDAAVADPALIPDFSQMTDPAFAAVGKTNYIRCAYQLMTDNLLDLTHVAFVHTTTIGNAQFGGKATLSSRKTDTGVTVKRLVENVPPPPTYVKSGRLPEGKNIDRWQLIEFIAPSFVKIHVGGAETGTGALDGKYEHGLNLWVLNAMTPETATTTHYFWGSVRCHAVDDPAVDALFLAQIGEAFAEDATVLEAQQLALDKHGDTWNLALRADTGSIEARRVLAARIASQPHPH